MMPSLCRPVLNSSNAQVGVDPAHSTNHTTLLYVVSRMGAISAPVAGLLEPGRGATEGMEGCLMRGWGA